jgi:hypothetical protein
MYEILKDFGILAAIGSGIIALLVFLAKYIIALARGVQASMRSQLADSYHLWHEERGYAPMYIKDAFENCYQRYHRLGKNGVMDNIHEEFMRLPTEPQKEERNEEN